ncbi:MAG: hypothetical protein DRP58_02225 [Spirochaetes bacterium]|nr:MAG: hypothetical protein DRP58_02225 [Spirochaetota bacterium]
MKNVYIIFFFFINLVFLYSNEDPLIIKISYYGEIGCSHCDLFEDSILPEIEEKTETDIELQAFDILDSKVYEECETALNKLGLDFTIFPVLFIGNNAYLGNSALEAGLVDEINYVKKNGEYRPFNSLISTTAGKVSFKIIPVFIAGLIDGINPCAFATLLFFISFLSIQGRTKREILIIGILFTFSVFLTYFLLGLGLLNALRMVLDFSFIRFFVKIVVSIVTLVFLIISLRDFYLARKGRFSEITLQLSLSMKKRLHRVVRKNNTKVFFLSGVIVTGFTVSVIELACTGQVYLPTIAYMIQTDNSVLGLRSLLIYNLSFILPMVIIFALVYAGLRFTDISSFFKGKVHYTKLLLSALFMFLAVVIWFV